MGAYDSGTISAATVETPQPSMFPTLHARRTRPTNLVGYVSFAEMGAKGCFCSHYCGVPIQQPWIRVPSLKKGSSSIAPYAGEAGSLARPPRFQVATRMQRSLRLNMFKVQGLVPDGLKVESPGDCPPRLEYLLSGDFQCPHNRLQVLNTETSHRYLCSVF